MATRCSLSYFHDGWTVSKGACVPGNVPLTQPLVRESGEKGGGSSFILAFEDHVSVNHGKLLLFASTTFNLAASLPSNTIPEKNRLKLNSN